MSRRYKAIYPEQPKKVQFGGLGGDFGGLDHIIPKDQNNQFQRKLTILNP